MLASHGAQSALSAAQQRVLTGRRFFPELISGPFHQGLSVVLLVATALAMLAAVASMLRGPRDTSRVAASDGPGARTGNGERTGPGERTGTAERASPGEPAGAGERTGSTQQISA